MNYAGQIVSVSPITKTPELSLWVREGLALPEKIEQFFEQCVGSEVVTMVRWTPKVAPKSKDEIGAK